jgi:hypothetical protein
MYTQSHTHTYRQHRQAQDFDTSREVLHCPNPGFHARLNLIDCEL